jgi:predicted MFS family arabinose efflux permease
MEKISLEAAFFIDSATFLIPAIAVALIAIPYRRQAKSEFNLGKDLREGIRFSLSQPVVIVALATITAAFFVIGTISVSGVVITHDILHVESSKFGYMMSGLGGGMLIGAVVTNILKRWISGVQAGVAGSILMGAALIILPFSTSLEAASLIAAVAGVGMIMVQINGQLLLQTIAPDMRGRLMGISQTLTGSATFFASAAVGLMLEYLPVTLVMGIVGISTIVVASAAAIHFRTSSKGLEPSK